LLRKPIDREELLQSLEHALTTEPEPGAQSDGDTAGAAFQARRLSDLLTRVSEVLAQGTDIAAQLREVARAIVPASAAACVVERLDTAAALREVLCTQHESAALDADLRTWACQPDWLSHVISEVVDSGRARLIDLQENARRGTHADVASARALGFESVVVVPMIARQRLFGILTCAARATRRYGRAHLEAFAELGHRVALALDNVELMRAAQEARSDQDELLHALTSELQAPLAALSDQATQALRLADASPARSLAELFAHETRRMHAQLRELIDFSRLRAGHSQLRMQDLELAPLLRRVVERARIADGRATLTSRFDDVSGLQVHADPERIAQAFEVLLLAALANTPDDGKLELYVSRIQGDLQVTLHGSGTKLSTQELAGLGDLTSHGYEPSHASGAASLARPRGGLRLARTLIEMQGGRLWADSAESDSNTAETLHVGLPLCAAHARTNTVQPSPETVILLVDSDLAFRRELQEILSERGYMVQTADNGLQAWQYLLGHSPPALILFDLVLPAMDGWELHAAIKSHAALQLVPTVVVSGLDRYRIEASLPDAHGYIEKPIRSAQLFEMVQRHVASPARPRTLSVRPSSCF
jgi:CheY-like chemotaxis protein/K+-sensing histidine kinase KdpD